MRIYVHRNFLSFNQAHFGKILQDVKFLRDTRAIDVADVVCVDFFHTQYFHKRSELNNRYSKTHLDRYYYRYF